jgi:hypothetical protein
VTLFLHKDGTVQDIPAESLRFEDGRFAQSIDLFDEDNPKRRKTFDRYSQHLKELGRCTVVFLERATHVGLDERLRVALRDKYVAPKRLPLPTKGTAA